jgi:hypothetical protein
MDYFLIFIAILVAFILCTFLGNGLNIFYNTARREGMEGNSDGTSTSEVVTYYGPNGSSAEYNASALTITVTDASGTKTVYHGSGGASAQTFTGENGGTATVIQTGSGGSSIVFTESNGEQTAIFKTDTGRIGAASTKSYDNYNHFDGSTTPIVFYGPNDSTLRVVNTDGQKTIVVTDKGGVTTVYSLQTPDSTTYVSATGGSATVITGADGKKTVEITTSSGDKLVYYDDAVYAYDSSSQEATKYIPNNSSGGSDYSSAFDTNTYSTPADSTITTVTGPGGNTAATSTSSQSEYYDSLPAGVPRSQIPPGNEDLYILKSQVVPPVCPACPTMQCPDTFDKSKCPPCEPCGRCPEPNFDCKKVPNYNAFNQNTMPVPVLNSFSSFAM